MSHLSPRPEQSTTAEISLLTALNNLAAGGVGTALQKTSATTFSNVTLSTSTGTVTSVSVVTANGVSGSVATATTTPAITITLGAITPTSVNGLTISTTTGTLTVTNAKTIAFSNSITFAGTDSTTMTFPTTSATLARTDAGNTFTGVSTASAWVLTSPTVTTKLNPTTDDGAPLGDTTHNWSDLFLATGAVINYANSNVVITHSSGILTMGTGELRITTVGTNTASVVTVGGTQTLTAKTLTSPVITTSPTAAGSTWADLGTVTTIDINGGTLDAVVVGGASAAAGTFTTIVATTSIKPSADDGAPLGDATHNFSDLFLASGAVVNYANSNVVITHTSGILTMGTGELRITTVGTNTASVVTVGGTQTLTAKTLTSPTITTSPTAAGATWTDLGTVTTADINGGTLDGVVIGGASAAAATVTTLGAGAITSTGLLSVTLAGNTADFKNTTDAASVQIMKLEGDRATMAANDEAYISLHLSDSAGNQDEMARITWKATTVTSTSEVSRLAFSVVTAGALAEEVYLTGTAFSPAASDGNALGTTALMWADLFLASGAVVNFNNGNMTLTHAAGTLTFAGGTIALGTATVTTLNSLTVTTSAGTLTIANNASASLITSGNFALTLTASATTNATFFQGSHTVAGLDVSQTWSGTQTYGDSVIVATTPKIITGLKDTNGNAWLNVSATGSAVNYVTVTNAATGTAGPQVAADGETNVDLKVAAKGTGKIHLKSGSGGDITAYSPSAAATATLTLNTSNIHTITMPVGNITIALSNEQVGQCFMINIIQDSVGSRTVTWFTTIKWAGGVAPTLTTTANKIDTFGFLVTSAGNYEGFVIGQNI